jgi:hypothetical protein
MRDYRDAKAIAQTLRDLLAARTIPISHAESLELVAKLLGCNSWNVLSAAIQSGKASSEPRPRAREKNGKEVPLIALRDLVLFPGLAAPIFVGRVSTKQAVEAAVAIDNRALMVTQKRPEDDDPALADLWGHSRYPGCRSPAGRQHGPTSRQGTRSGEVVGAGDRSISDRTGRLGRGNT